MIKKILFILVFSILGKVTAQIKEGSFDDIVDYCACKIANTYMAKYTEPKEFRKQYPLNETKDEYEKTKSIFEADKKSYEKTLKNQLGDCENLGYKQLLIHLNNGGYTTLKSKLKNIIEKLNKESDSIRSSIDEIVNFFYIYEGKDSENKKLPDLKYIVNTYKSVLDPLKKKLLSGDGYLKTNFQEIQEEKEDETGNGGNGNNEEFVTNITFSKKIKDLRSQLGNKIPQTWLLWLLVTALIIFCSILLYLHNNTKKRLNRHREEIEELKKNLSQGNQNNNSSFNNTNNPSDYKNLNNQIRGLSKKLDEKFGEYSLAITNLQREVGEIKTKINRQSEKIIPLPNTQTGTKPKIVTDSDNEPTRDALYATAPDADGSFLTSQVFETKQSNSYYKLAIYVSNPNKAKFSFIDNQSNCIDAFNQPDLILEHVCEEPEGNINGNPSRIITKIPGIIEKQGNKWILKTKAKIRYE